MRMRSLLRPVLPLLVAAFSLASPALAQQTLRGTLHVVWDGEETAGRPDGVRHYLVQPDGRATELLLGEDEVRRMGGVGALDRRRVEVSGNEVPGRAGLKTLRAFAVKEAEGEPRTPDPTSVPPQAFVVLLCRFADEAGAPVTPGQMETLMGPTYPGMGHFYAELSGDPAVMAANRVAGWFTLPQPRSAYIDGTETNHGTLARDCAAAADPTVDFSPYYGVAFQFNGPLAIRNAPPHDTVSYGGSWSLTVDGAAQRAFGVTWISSNHASSYMVHAHEMGHALGWPHSSGSYGQEYDSHWDLMSRGYLRFQQPWGWHSIHTIAPHKDQKGWIPPSRRWIPAPASEERRSLARGALPPAGEGYLIARIPKLHPGQEYVVEARRVAGYDNPLPGEAVIIHEMMGNRAFVVDPDLNGNPNDAAAMWLPGETFTDSVNGVQVLVTGETDGRFDVTIRRGWRLAVDLQGPGTVQASGWPPCGGDCAVYFGARNQAVTVVATPAAGYTFAGWGGACSGTGACTVTMGGERFLTARFAGPGGVPEIVSDTLLRAGAMGAAYADTLEAEGVTGAAAWTVTGGALPEGVALNAATGVVTGVPAQSGVFRFTATLAAGGFTDARTFRLEVARPTVAAPAVMEHLLGGTPLAGDLARFLDLAGNRNGRVDVGDVRAWLQSTGGLAPDTRELRELLDAMEPAPKTGRTPSTQP